jgi:predicted nucleotidyltransferase
VFSEMEEVKALLEALTAGIRQALSPKLLGLYLWGSYVVGDFDPRISDVDLVAALAADVSEEEFLALQAMHDALAQRFPAWAGRVEVAYATVATLDRPVEGGEIVRISPGEPLNRRRSDERWIVDWYVVRERGIALFGPPPVLLLAPISREQFVDSVRANVAAWDDLTDWANERQRQAYAILLLCRALRATTHGDQLSKPAAGRWAQHELPEWADLIGRAVAWRQAPKTESETAADARADTEFRRFVEDVRRRIIGE